MDRILVAYGSKYDSTAEIARAVGEQLSASGLEVDVKKAASVGSLDAYRGVIVGSAVYMGRWRKDAWRLLKKNRNWLATHPVWLFSSGPVGEDDENEDPAEVERWTKPQKVRDLAAEIGAHDHVVFGGMVDEQRGVMRRKMAQDMPDEARDRRDWNEISAWAAGVASVLLSASDPATPSG